MSLVHGPTQPALVNLTLGELIDQQAERYADRPCLIFPFQNTRITFQQLAERSKKFATALVAAGLRPGDTVGIFAGNTFQYLEVFCAAARVGCPSVSLNATYTPVEVVSAVKHASCKALFLSTSIKSASLDRHIEALLGVTTLAHIVLLDDSNTYRSDWPYMQTYEEFMHSSAGNDEPLSRRENQVKPHDILNIQFTSGTTSSPKACLLSHYNLINNSLMVASRTSTTASDILVTPLPLFHCFGLGAGFLSPFIAGATCVYPSPSFDPIATVRAVVEYKATMLHSVPTMFVAAVSAAHRLGLERKIKTLERGIVSGASAPTQLLLQIQDILGMKSCFGAWGMTETSAGAVVGFPSDPFDLRTVSCGKIMPHCSAKIVSPSTGKVLPIGQRGELVVGGYLVCQGYLNQREKTDKAISSDENGLRWVKTGDEVYIDENGYFYITGRIKDVIIRGGENVYPAEIEARLAAHLSIAESSVVGLKDERLGEVVAAFVRQQGSDPRPRSEELAEWVGATLGRHKRPKHIFWINDPEVGNDFPKTGSGKHQKHILRSIGEKLLKHGSGGKSSSKL